MRPTRFPLVAISLAILILAHPACVAAVVKFRTAGTYVDAGGGQHAWSINDAHTLIWDGEPYIPVGGAFVSRYLSLDASDDNYKADIAALKTAKSKGITDVILKSTQPITSGDPAAWQRMIDYLEANGFTYGIELADGPALPLSGYVVTPALYRLEGPTNELAVVREWSDVDSAIFVVARLSDNSIQAMGGAVVKDGKVTIEIGRPLAAGEVLLVYPRKTFKNGGGDLWSGFGEYRDRLLAFFRDIKLGAGLRFFIEPFTCKTDFEDEMAGFVPDSGGFRIGFEAYLTQRHMHEGSINAAWGLLDNLPSVEAAARLIPMWAQGRGLSYAYDRASAKLYPVESGVTRLWNDLADYRDSSTQQFMNTIADALKKNVANVPVIFKTSRHHRIYANPYGIGGFDGLGAAAYGTADVPVTTVAGPAYALAEESGKSTWYIVAATSTTLGPKTLVGYPNEPAMAAALDYFREIGCKGFFVDSLQALPEEERGNYSILRAPEQLDWLAAFKSKVDKAAWVDFRPDVVYYPVTPLTGASVKRLARNAWWLPSLRTGRTSYIGDGLAAYGLTGEDRSVIWSVSGERTVTLQAVNKVPPTVEFPPDTSIDKKKSGAFSIQLTDVPLALKGMDISLLFPFETAEAEMAKLSAAIVEADKMGLDVKRARESLDRAKDPLKNGLPMTAYGMVQTALQELLQLMGRDVWLEAEDAAAHNFAARSASGASGGVALVLDTASEAPLGAYAAALRANADANSSYEIWIAATPPPECSPMSFSVDGMVATPLAPVDGTPSSYAPGLAWYKIGAANLLPGNHTIKFKAEGPRSQDGRYYFAIDALVLSPRGFKPDGLNKPF